MIPPIRRQIAGNRSNHHCTNYNSMMTRRNPGRNISGTTYKNSNKRITMRKKLLTILNVTWPHTDVICLLC